MPIDTFNLPGYEQALRRDDVAVSDEYISAGIDQIQAHANHQSSAQEIEDAILTPQQRAEKAAQWVLEESDEYHPEVFDRMNQEAHQADSYYTQQREVVAAPQAQEIVGVTYEAAQELSAHPEQNLPRLSNVGKLVVASRSELVLTA